jgi:hypothetical protein
VRQVGNRLSRKLVETQTIGQHPPEL